MSKASEGGTFAYMIEPKRPEMVKAPTADETAKVDAHFKYLKDLHERGVALFVGRSTEPPHFGIVVFRAADRAAAQAIVDGDPAVKAGIFKARLQEFRQVFEEPPKKP